jgi:hypothetical protein
MTFEEIAQLEGLRASLKALNKAFEKEGYFRWKATRLVWAKLHRSWKFDIWKRVVWTDEASFTTGDFGSIYVTRQIEEEYNRACCNPKFRGFSSQMVHESISGS